MKRVIKFVPLLLVALLAVLIVRFPDPKLSVEIPPVRTESLPANAAQPRVPVTSEFAVPVLMYHRICDLTPDERANELTRDLTVSPAAFEEQIRHLHENGFSFLLASEVESAVKLGKPLPAKAICLTMDDGYKDNFERAFPILQRYGIPATIFLVTSTVDTARHLSWDEVNIMHREKVGFGSHTVHHYDLPGLSVNQLDYELRESRRVIESKLLERISAIAYPSGRYNDTVVQRARLAGYEAGWKKGGGPVQPGAEMFLLPRVRVNGSTTLKDFRRKVWSGVYTLAERRERIRRVAAR